MPTKDELKLLQALPLEIKKLKSQARIREWINYYGVENTCVAFSGGKDSTVLLNLVRELYPNVRAVFSDTGLEYPEIRQFVKSFENVDWVKPKLTFRDIVIKYGYPLFSKEVAETIRYARKIVGGGYDLSVPTKTTWKECLYQRKTLQGKRIAGERNCRVFRWATGREQVYF